MNANLLNLLRPGGQSFDLLCGHGHLPGVIWRWDVGWVEQACMQPCWRNVDQEVSYAAAGFKHHRYPTDLIGAEWKRFRPAERGRKPKVDLREMLNMIHRQS